MCSILVTRETGGWSGRAIAAQLKIPPSTLSSWVSSDLISPDSYSLGRKGHVFGVSAVFEIITIAELRESGFSITKIRKVINNLRIITGKARPLTELILIINGDDIAWIESGNFEELMFSSLKNPGQRIMIFPIGIKHEKFKDYLLK